MSSRFTARVAIIACAIARRLAGGKRRAPARPKRILVAHHLLLGDTLMLTPTLAKLRRQFPDADIAMAMPEAFTPLYARRPYGARPLGWNPRNPDSVVRLLREPAFDLALIPGDNRHSWLAQAMGARWIVAFAGDRPGYKSWPVDELRSYSSTSSTWFDMTAMLVDGEPPLVYRTVDWSAPDAAPFARPDGPYAVLHVGASSSLKLWPPERWRTVAALLRARGHRIAWSGGRGEEALVAACAPESDDVVTAGRLDLAQLWHLVSDARVLLCPDTGIAHLGRIVGTPTIALFGPGSALLAGPGSFWRDSPYRALSVVPFPCRDQHVLFKREIPWVQICKRSSAECASPRCMHALEVAAVMSASQTLLDASRADV
ncbi:MAG: glycosyltransferase family 9 protein [Betaproteobacteria bacterium]